MRWQVDFEKILCYFWFGEERLKESIVWVVGCHDVELDSDVMSSF